MTTPKRPRLDQDVMDEEEAQAATLKEAWSKLRSSINLHDSLDELWKSINETEGGYAGLYTFQYFKDASLENRYSTPEPFEHFEVRHDKHGEVVAISDGKSKLTGARLKKVMAVWGMILMGMETVVIGEVTDEFVEVIAQPRGTRVMEVKDLESKRKKKRDGIRRVWHRKGSTMVYPSEALIKKVATLDFVSMAKLREVLSCLNQVVSRAGEDGVQTDKLADSTELQKLVDDSDVKRSQALLYSTLLALKLTSLSIDERVDYFGKHATYDLAVQFGFRLPHPGPVFSKVNNARASAVKLADAGDDDAILLSSNVIDQAQYARLQGDVGELQCHVYSEDVGIRKANKWHKMPVAVTMKKSDLLGIMGAIAKANGANKGEKKADEADGDLELLEEMEL
jgi:hypothetical protein